MYSHIPLRFIFMTELLSDPLILVTSLQETSSCCHCTQVFDQSHFKEVIDDSIGFPPAAYLPRDTQYSILCEEGVLLKMRLVSWSHDLEPEQDKIQISLLACIYLHNVMRLRYTGFHNLLLDIDDNKRLLVHAAWRNGHQNQDIENIEGGRHASGKQLKQQSSYLNHSFSSSARANPWQSDVI